MVVYVDFETRSVLDLKKVGMWRYAEDPSTEVVCMAYAIDDGPVRLWHRGYDSPESEGIVESPPPEDLFSAITDRRTTFEAHNVNFERCMWLHWASARGWPRVLDGQWECSAAKAAMHNLPRALEDVSLALNLAIKKNMEGHRVMLKLTRPRKPSKTNPNPWYERLEDLKKLWSYCKGDVEVERLLSKKLKPLNRKEQAIFYYDMKINERGIYCDRGMVNKAVNLIAEVCGELNREIFTITGGSVPSASQRETLRRWVNDNGIPLPDTAEHTVSLMLKTIEEQTPGAHPEVRRVLEICRSVNRTSTAKYESMRERRSGDGRIKGTLLYCGASQTRRWAGRGIQPHNYPRGSLEDMEAACDDIMKYDADTLGLLYPDVMELLSWTLRGALTAAPGKELLVSDFSGIEARITFWYGDQQDGLDVFRRGEDIYKFTAKDIYRTTYERVKKDQRQVGKQAVLGLGFGMGGPKFIVTCAKYGIKIDREFADTVVTTYRNKYSGVKAFWYACDNAAKNAVRCKGKAYRAGKVVYIVEDDFLFCILPSGGRLAYYKPALIMKETPWGEEREAVSFMGVNGFTQKWERMDTYGGKLVENIVQGTARDLMAEAIVRIERTEEYPIILSVHDELIAEVLEGEGDKEEYERLMAETPDWAEGLPVAVEGWRGKRYKK